MKYKGNLHEMFQRNEHCVHITNGKGFPKFQHMLQRIYEITNITIDELRWNDINCGFKLPYICKRMRSVKGKGRVEDKESSYLYFNFSPCHKT